MTTKNRWLKWMGSAGLLLVLFMSVAVEAQSVLLNGSSNLSGSYTYFARGNTSVTSGNTTGGITPFAVAFYPGSTGTGGAADKGASQVWNQSFSSSNAGAISFASGTLTDGITSGSNTSVTGWQGIIQYVSSSTGKFDILFDLGDVYQVTEIVITYSSGTGVRIAMDAGGQTAWTSITAPTSDGDLTQFGSSLTPSSNDTAGGNATLDFTGSATARYVDVRLDVGTLTTFTSGSAGAQIREIQIYGVALVPESSTWLLLGIGALVLGCYAMIKRNHGLRA